MKMRNRAGIRTAGIRTSVKRLLVLVLAAFMAALPLTAAAAEETPRWQRPLKDFGKNLMHTHIDSRAIPFHLAAGASALLLVYSDADVKIQNWAAGHDQDLSVAWSEPGVAGGFFMPVLLPGGMLYFSDNARTQEAGAAALQAAAIAWLSSSLAKAITNRNDPEEGVKATRAEARDFNFGFLRQNVFSGFPSSHAATNMAMSAALAAYYPDRPNIRLAAYGWAAYVGAAMALGDQGGLHWTSDVVAGSIMGWIIGDMVGKRARQGKTEAGGLSIMPDLRNNGVLLSYEF